MSGIWIAIPSSNNVVRTVMEEEIMETVNQTMTHLVVGGGLLLMALGSWALIQELLPVVLR